MHHKRSAAGDKNEHWGRTGRDKSPMLKPCLFTFICVPTSLTAEHQKPFWILWDRADKYLMTGLASIIYCTTSWFHYVDSTKKAWTSTVSMFKIYLLHAENIKCTMITQKIKAMSMAQTNFYGFNKNSHSPHPDATSGSKQRLQEQKPNLKDTALCKNCMK